MMGYSIIKTMEIAGSHRLKLKRPSPCTRLHGHNWKITVCVECEWLREDGMVMDFGEISSIVKTLDHQDIRAKTIGGNPTAENIARWIADRIHGMLGPDQMADREVGVRWVKVQETEGNEACYTP